MRNGYLGAVLVGYDIAADGSLENVAILGEVPSNVFSEAALDAVTHWEVKGLPGDEPRCRRNRLTSLHFTAGN
jgi:TonB family protein